MANVAVLLFSSYTSRLVTSVLLFFSVAHTQNTVGKTLLLKLRLIYPELTLRLQTYPMLKKQLAS